MRVREATILNSACQIFKQRGVRSSNLQQIARASNASLWEITLLFPSKKQLVLAVFRHLLQKNFNYLTINPAISPTAVAELASFFRIVETVVGELGPELLAELKRYLPVSLEQLKDIVDQKLMPYMDENLARGVREGFYRQDIDLLVFSPTYFSLLHTTLTNETLDWTATIATIRQFHEISLRGILTTKGMRL